MEKVSYYPNEAEDFLKIKEKELDSDSRSKWGAEQLKLIEADFYLRKLVSGAGEQDLITASTNEKRGTTNIDKARLPSLQNLVLNKIRFAWGFVATGTTDPAVITYGNKITADLPVALRHSILQISQDNKVIIERAIDLSLGVEVSRDVIGEDVPFLKKWEIIKADRPITIKLLPPEGATIAKGTDNVFLEVRLMGYKTVVR